MSSRQKLLEKAREAVDSSGYVYKKGKSRSKRLCSPTEELVGAKRVRTTASIRMDRIHALEEQIKDISDTIKYKEKRREQASAVHNYKLCEDLTDEMGTLKAKRRECETEIKQWQRKQKQSNWNQKRKAVAKPIPVSPTSSDSESQFYPSVTPRFVPARRLSWSSQPPSSGGSSPARSCSSTPGPYRVMRSDPYTPCIQSDQTAGQSQFLHPSTPVGQSSCSKQMQTSTDGGSSSHAGALTFEPEMEYVTDDNVHSIVIHNSESSDSDVHASQASNSPSACTSKHSSNPAVQASSQHVLLSPLASQQSHIQASVSGIPERPHTLSMQPCTPPISRTHSGSSDSVSMSSLSPSTSIGPGVHIVSPSTKCDKLEARNVPEDTNRHQSSGASASQPMCNPLSDGQNCPINKDVSSQQYQNPPQILSTLTESQCVSVQRFPSSPVSSSTSSQSVMPGQLAPSCPKDQHFW